MKSDKEYADFASALIRAARTDLWSFVMLIRPPKSSGFVFSKCHLFLMQMVQDIVDGKLGRRNGVSMPPQHGKSTVLSILSTAWVLGRVPEIQVAMTGYSHDLTTDFSKAVKDITQSPLYQLVFPNTSIMPSYDKSDSWLLMNGSGVRAKSVGKKLTGRRVDWLLIDDAHSGRREAESALARKRVVEWYFGDCVTRLSPNANVFIIGTRWHPSDLIGTLTSAEYQEEMLLHGKHQELFQVLNMEAICTDSQADPLGRNEGEALFPEMRDVEFLDNIRLGIPAYEWESQFQGKPRSQGAGQVDLSKIRKIDLEEVPPDIEWLRGWDLALTTKKTSDFTCGALCAYDKRNDHFYIIDMYRQKKAWAQVKEDMLRTALMEKKERNVNRMAMEAVTGFAIGYEEVKKELMGHVKVEKRNPSSDKLMRAQPWFNKVEAMRVSIVKGKWNKEFLDELDLFPSGVHDDQIDAVSIAYESLTQRTKLLYA